MRALSISLLIIVVVILSGCNSSEQLKPIKEETIDFDIKTAIEMVEKKEKLILDIALRENLSKIDYDQAEKALTEEFGDRGEEILTMFIINDMDSISDTYVMAETFYPTVFHEGIVVTDASIYKSYYEYESLNMTRLSIKEEYIGDDEKLKGWNREYIFDQNEEGQWEFHGFSGTVNLMGEDYDMGYLELNY
ncbi:hypothetical protein [Paenibacillus endoradicis]|uniref:hypothetical protein n=1 Tax=Paenibacillus endoradicis TaxID=2972487 RepID=UPI002159B212|nr:hypothetical protein [Paenibacillus endoradicis]MCR8656489.1 hypothetical protein [Paenibacillus endoradicis]